MEQWRDILGYEGLYQVSDWGRVKSLNYNHTGVERLLRPQINGKAGYNIVFLQSNGVSEGYLVHRLVAEAFIPNPDNLPEVNHRDENKGNNAASNLEWCTREYNMNYGTRTERTSKPVFQYTLDGSLVRSYPSTREAERRTGYANQNISACCKGKFKTMYGFVWSYDLFAPRGRLF